MSKSTSTAAVTTATLVPTEAQRRSFHSDGFLAVGQILADRDVEALKDEATRLMGGPNGPPPALPEDHLMRSIASAPDGKGQGHVRVALHVCHLSDAFRAQALDRAAVAIARDLLGEDPVVLTSLVFNKPPQVGEPLDLHQDRPYYPYLGDDDLVTCWTALDAVDLENGCVEYLPGSHRSQVNHRATGLQQAMDIDPAQVDTSRAVAVALEPGECVFHHGLTIHRSGANRSGRPRMGVAMLYVRASANVSLDDFAYPVLVPAHAQVVDETVISG